MSQMHQIVKLHPLVDAGGAHGGPIDRRVGTNLHIVVDNHIAHLGYFLVMAVLLGCETEPVGPNHSPGVKDASLTHHGVAIKTDTGIQHRMVTDHTTIADIHLGIDFDMVSQRHALTHEGELAQIEVFAIFGRGRHKSQRRDPPLVL